MEKSKVEPLSSFSIGLTQLEEEKRNVTASSFGGDKNKQQKTGEAKGKKKKQQRNSGKKKHEKKKHKKNGDKRIASTSLGRKKKQQTKTQDSDEGRSDDENEESGKKDFRGGENAKQNKAKKDSDADQRLRHKMSIPKVYELMHSVHGKRRKNEIVEQLNDCGFGGMLHICNWTKIHIFFVDWVVRNFEKEHMWIRLSKTMYFH
ncbi:unnamed protein product [Trifolium pratense]|uniref:Uncharacterized protein n=1 Tax=Trifolium pratense TaxID=57577 RepID=A0ACB0K096_TRIPR|nr:unnamed protein product [Trifolium pratense]